MGACTAVLCLFLVSDIITAVSMVVIVYIISDRFLRQIFIEKVEKPSVVTKTGIGIFIITWLLLWILLFTVMHPDLWNLSLPQ